MTFQPSSQIAINCILAKRSAGLEGDGCVYDLSAPHQRNISPSEKLRVGDYVRLRLWLPGEDSHIAIDMAEVEWVENHRIKIELLSVSPEVQARLSQFKISENAGPRSYHTTEQILIRF
ncbi:MAG: hypothetical protein OEY86_07360 [Nitrospira sp.]|nr:hypothetical protein [Nitrospira sp.]